MVNVSTFRQQKGWLYSDTTSMNRRENIVPHLELRCQNIDEHVQETSHVFVGSPIKHQASTQAPFAFGFGFCCKCFPIFKGRLEGEGGSYKTVQKRKKEGTWQLFWNLRSAGPSLIFQKPNAAVFPAHEVRHHA
jgi:hypothetical protein